MKGGRFLLLAAIAMLVAAAFFAALAFSSPVKSFGPPACSPANTPDNPVTNVNPCESLLVNDYLLKMNSEAPLVPLYMDQFWVYTSYVEIEWGFVLAAAILLLSYVVRSTLGKIPSISLALTRPVPLPKSAKKAVLLISFLGAVSYFSLLDFGLSVPFVTPFLDSAFSVGRPPLNLDLGTVAFAFAAITTLGLTVYRLDRGLVSAFTWSLMMFSFPAVLVQTVGLALDGLPNQAEMVIYVTKFAQWSFGSINFDSGWEGIYVLSNWTVLAVAASLFLVLVMENLHLHSAVRQTPPS